MRVTCIAHITFRLQWSCKLTLSLLRRAWTDRLYTAVSCFLFHATAACDDQHAMICTRAFVISSELTAFSTITWLYSFHCLRLAGISTRTTGILPTSVVRSMLFIVSSILQHIPSFARSNSSKLSMTARPEDAYSASRSIRRLKWATLQWPFTGISRSARMRSMYGQSAHTYPHACA